MEYVPVCPEVESGFPVPREAFRLVGDPAAPRLLTRQSGVDCTAQMERWLVKKLPLLEKENLCGFIFKSKSPSSGMERVKVYNEKGVAEKNGVGIFARALMERLPLLPVEEEGRLQDIDLRENFIVRIFVYRRWRELLASGATAGRLVDFQRRHKLLLMAHSPEMARRLGKAGCRGRDPRRPAATFHRVRTAAADRPEAESHRAQERQRPAAHVRIFQKTTGRL